MHELDPTVLNEPSTQGEQSEDPLTLLLPAKQSSQESKPLPPTLFLPGLQSLQVAVLPSENDPAEQVSQVFDPETLSDFFPTSQAVQGSASELDFFPAVHGTQSLAPVKLYDPARHLEQVVSPEIFAIVPASHAEHSI